MEGVLHVIHGTVSLDGGIGHSWIHVDCPRMYLIPQLQQWQDKKTAIKNALEFAKQEKYHTVAIHDHGGREVERIAVGT